MKVYITKYSTRRSLFSREDDFNSYVRVEKYKWGDKTRYRVHRGRFGQNKTYSEQECFTDIEKAKKDAERRINEEIKLKERELDFLKHLKKITKEYEGDDSKTTSEISSKLEQYRK